MALEHVSIDVVAEATVALERMGIAAVGEATAAMVPLEMTAPPVAQSVATLVSGAIAAVAEATVAAAPSEMILASPLECALIAGSSNVVMTAPAAVWLWLSLESDKTSS